MFSNVFLKSFRILLFPFALLYGGIVILRNWLYDRRWLRSTTFNLPLICVGNLSVGGTGKSPMVEYLIGHHKGSFRLATLSRGYKRKTKGYALAGDRSTALEIGDEPMLFHHKFPDVPVAVGEERLVAIPQLLHDRPDTQAIVLDDAFQHRPIRAGLNILLTDHGNLYTRDFFLPTGDLRDSRSSAQRAQVIVVTKCPADLSVNEKAALTRELAPTKNQRLFFTTIVYGTPYHITGEAFIQLTDDTEVLLVTGIANPRPLKNYLEQRTHTYSMMHFGDHHIFSIDDWKDIQKRFQELTGERKLILTTEKDAMRLLKFENELGSMPFYVVPIEHRFLFEEGTQFDSIVHNFIQEFK
jgi:tetraacyldisaccharide 4'-kinase